MGINYSCKTKAKAALKLYNQIITYIFEVDKVVKLARSIKTLSPILYPEEDAPKIYVYTSIAAYFPIRQLLNVVDGIVLTPHSKDDVKRFIKLNERLRMYLAENPQLKSSLRLNLFKNIKDMLPEDIDLSIWKVKDMEWIKDCPVPKGEDFKRLSILWKE